MSFLALLLVLGSENNISHEEVILRHSAFCQNLYFQPGSIEKMQKYDCDIEAVTKEISKVQEGKY